MLIYIVWILYSHSKILYANAAALSNKLVELQLIIEFSCHDIAVMTEVLPKNSHFYVCKSVFYLADCQLFWNCDFYEASRGVSIHVMSYNSATIGSNINCAGFDESLWLHISHLKGGSLFWVAFTKINHPPPQTCLSPLRDLSISITYLLLSL